MNTTLIILISAVVAGLVAAIVCLAFRLRDKQDERNIYRPAPGRSDRSASYRTNDKSVD